MRKRLGKILVKIGSAIFILAMLYITLLYTAHTYYNPPDESRTYRGYVEQSWINTTFTPDSRMIIEMGAIEEPFTPLERIIFEIDGEYLNRVIGDIYFNRDFGVKLAKNKAAPINLYMYCVEVMDSPFGLPAEFDVGNRYNDIYYLSDEHFFLESFSMDRIYNLEE
jgi:hypothetical protein